MFQLVECEKDCKLWTSPDGNKDTHLWNEQYWVFTCFYIDRSISSSGCLSQDAGHLFPGGVFCGCQAVYWESKSVANFGQRWDHPLKNSKKHGATWSGRIARWRNQQLGSTIQALCWSKTKGVLDSIILSYKYGSERVHSKNFSIYIYPGIPKFKFNLNSRCLTK